MNIPSHILIHPDTLKDALRGICFPGGLDNLPALLDAVQRQVQALIAEMPAPASSREPDAGRSAVLRAVTNLLAVIREAVGASSGPMYQLTVPSRREPGLVGAVGARAPVFVVPYARLPGAGRALLLEEFTWLDVIDSALSSVIGQGWADEEAEEAQSVVQGILTGHVPLARLREELTLFEGDLVPWLDVIDETLSWARDALEPSELGWRIGDAHDLVQAILTGHVPLERLLETVPPGYPPDHHLCLPGDRWPGGDPTLEI